MYATAALRFNMSGYASPLAPCSGSDVNENEVNIYDPLSELGLNLYGLDFSAQFMLIDFGNA